MTKSPYIFPFILLFTVFFLSLLSPVHNNVLLKNIFLALRVILNTTIIALAIDHRRKESMDKLFAFVLILPLIFALYKFHATRYFDYFLLISSVYIFCTLKAEELCFIVKRTTQIYFVLLLLLCILTFFQINPIAEITGPTLRRRLSVGFWNTNISGYFYTMIVGGSILLGTPSRIKVFKILFLGLFLYVITDTRVLLIGVILWVFYSLISVYRLRKTVQKVLYVFTFIITCILAIYPFMLHFLFSIRLKGIDLDIILSRRLIIAQKTMGSFNLLSYLTGNMTIPAMDSFSINLLSNAGLFVYLLFFYRTLSRIHMHQKRVKIIVFMLLFLAVGIFESNTSSTNFISIIFYSLLLKDDFYLLFEEQGKTKFICKSNIKYSIIKA